eukprot:GFUD01035025.1.p1 GENE.GFUD01035025.1~~GFUD01035025.1.p1  ORF type:complete len:369 (-),score=103.21 GFUD01035025.1:84-1190(-)
MAISAVKWSSFLGPYSPVPHDMIFKVTESRSEPERKMHIHVNAHKFVLAAVSTEFKKLFYPEAHDIEPFYQSGKTEIEVTSSTVEAVQAMLQFVYDGEPQFPVDDAKQLTHTFHSLNLAHQYKIQGLVDLLESNISSFRLSAGNVKEVAQCAAQFGHLSQTSGDLLFRCLNFSYNQSTLTTLLAIGKQCYKPSLVAGALTRLRCRVSDQNLWSMARLGEWEDCFSGEQEVIQASKELQKRCVERLTDLMKYPKKFARITAGLSTEDDQTYRKLMLLLDELFCENCSSVSCQDGKAVDDDVKEGTKVKLATGEKGEVAGIRQLVKKVKLELNVTEDDASAPDTACIKIRFGDGTIKLNDSSSEVYFDCS